MGIRKRKGSPFYWYDFTVLGARFRGSCETSDRSQAEIIAAKLRSDALLGGITGQRPKITLDEACARYVTEHAKYLPSAKTIIYQSRNLLKLIGKTMSLDHLDDNQVARYVAKRRGSGVSDSTVNREMQTLRAIMNMAACKWKHAVADVSWRQHRLPEPDHRDRYLTPEEATRLIDCAAPHLKPAIATALYTALRLRNVLDLEWSQIDMRQRLITVRVKSRRKGGKVLSVPMAPGLAVLLAKLNPQARGPVFTFKGKPVLKMRTAFATALRKAGLDDFHWHDLRHTAASWMVDQDVPLDVVQRILGHSDIRMTQRYAHRSPAAQRDAVAALGAHWQPHGTYPAHSKKPGRL